MEEEIGALPINDASSPTGLAEVLAGASTAQEVDRTVSVDEIIAPELRNIPEQRHVGEPLAEDTPRKIVDLSVENAV